MAEFVTGDQYMEIDGKLTEIKRQLRQRAGYPFSVASLQDALQRVIEGKFDNLIDLDADPFVPDGWTVLGHKRDGLFLWNASKIRLHLVNGQHGPADTIHGTALSEQLNGQPVLNANVLDYLLAHPHLIPEKWKGKSVCFWGTMYGYSRGLADIRHLYWNGVSWCWGHRSLDSSWFSDSPTAMFAR